VWQRRWTLGDAAAAPQPDPDAVWLTDNDGAWTLIDTGDGALCVLSIHTVLGGSIPAGIAQTWATGALTRSLRTLAEMARGTAAHYGAEHDRVYTPDGAAIGTL
jgi:hypothetical protein